MCWQQSGVLEAVVVIKASYFMCKRDALNKMPLPRVPCAKSAIIMVQ